jgi:putative oxidoreductase
MSDVGLLLLRAGTGLLLFGYHGWGKLKAAAAFLFAGAEWGFPQGVANLEFPFPVFFAVCAALAESVAALLLAAGLWTRYAAAVVAFNMAVAFYHHARSDWKVEFALLYLLPAALFVLVPPGRLSLDALRGGGPKRN